MNPNTEYPTTTIAPRTIPDPDDIDQGEIMVSTNEDGLPFMVSFLCPCGCHEFIQLPVNNANPRAKGWDYSEEDGRATLSPSVHQRTACRSHYFIRAGTVQWA